MNIGEGDLSEDMNEEECAAEEKEPTVLVEDLPIEVQRRIRALKKNQLEITQIEAKFYQEMHELECKYLPLYRPLFDKRALILSGSHEPTDEECSLKEIGIEDLNEGINQVAIEDGVPQPERMKGVPQFWAQIFRNVEPLSDMVQEHDFPILNHLTDIQVEMMTEPMGFKLHFHFEPNEFFTNAVLTKTYFMKSEVDLEDPFCFEGPEIVRCTGCTIDWAQGKNVTVKTVKKKQKHKQRGNIRTVMKTVDVPSFFNFFNPPQIPEEGEAEMDEETQAKITNDFEVGQYIRERIVPRAVLYYTGEALEDEEDEEYSDDEEEEEEEEEEGEDEGMRAKKPKGRRGDPQGKPQECKQQ